MDKMDIKLLNILKKNARTSVSNIAIDLQITRTTVRTRMRKLKETGEISGFTVITKSDVSPAPVRGLVMLQIEGTGAHTIRQKLLLLQQVYSVYTTNGKWNMIIDLGTQSLAELDEILSKIQKFSGVKGFETSLLLSTKYA